MIPSGSTRKRASDLRRDRRPPHHQRPRRDDGGRRHADAPRSPGGDDRGRRRVRRAGRAEQRVGERIAALTGMAAGYVTCGSAAGMALAAAACIAGTDPERIGASPTATGWPTRSSSIAPTASTTTRCYASAAGGWSRSARLSRPSRANWSTRSPRTPPRSFMSIPGTATPARSISPRSSPSPTPATCRSSSTRPRPCRRRSPAAVGPLGRRSGHLQRRQGAARSAGLRLLAGRADLIAAARANGNPHAGSGVA